MVGTSPRECIRTRPAPWAAQASATPTSSRRADTSLMAQAPASRARLAVTALTVSTLTGNSGNRSTTPVSTGSKRRHSSSSETGVACGRVDSAPRSSMVAPSATSASAWASASSGSRCRPPSLNESGVTFTIPTTTGRSRDSPPRRISHVAAPGLPNFATGGCVVMERWSPPFAPARRRSPRGWATQGGRGSSAGGLRGRRAQHRTGLGGARLLQRRARARQLRRRRGFGRKLLPRRDQLHLFAVQRLALQQGRGHPMQRLHVGAEDLPRPVVGVLQNALHLLIHQLGGLLGYLVALRDLPTQEDLLLAIPYENGAHHLAHAELGDHAPGHLGGVLDVLRGSSRHFFRTEDQLFRHPAAVGHGQTAQDVRLGVIVPVFLRQREGESQRP